MSQLVLLRCTTPVWLIAVALGGLAWNAFGAFQFGTTVTSSEADFVASGMTAEQAAVMAATPVWMTLAFGLGVAGGLLGSGLLLARSGFAKPVLGLSLAAYIALWIGDALHGVFAAFGIEQIIILSTVVAIAAALFWVARRLTAQPAHEQA